MFSIVLLCLVFFFNDTATTEIYTLSLHDALPIYVGPDLRPHLGGGPAQRPRVLGLQRVVPVRVVVEEGERSEEHTSELQSRQYLVCRLLLEKKNTKNFTS